MPMSNNKLWCKTLTRPVLSSLQILNTGIPGFGCSKMTQASDSQKLACLTITWFIVKDCQMIKSGMTTFLAKNSHLKAEQTIPQFQTTALFVHSSPLN